MTNVVFTLCFYSLLINYSPVGLPVHHAIEIGSENKESDALVKTDSALASGFSLFITVLNVCMNHWLCNRPWT